jgi:hypothetical protein
MIVKVELTLDVPQSAGLDTSRIPSALTLDGSLASGVAVICLAATCLAAVGGTGRRASRRYP